jgi:hypothetical protein
MPKLGMNLVARKVRSVSTDCRRSATTRQIVKESNPADSNNQQDQGALLAQWQRHCYSFLRRGALRCAALRMNMSVELKRSGLVG